MRLKYDVSIIGLQAINRALATIERRFVMHNQRLKAKAANLEKGSTAGADAAERKRHALVMRNLASEKGALKGMWGSGANAGVRAQQKQHAMAMKNIRVEQAARNRFARTIGGRVGRRVGSTMRSVGAYGSMALGLGGGMLMASAVRSNNRAETAAMGLANQAVGTSDQMGRSRAQMSKAAMNKAAAVALSTGYSRAEILGGVRKFSEKAGGGFSVALPMAGYLADIADAHGADINDVGTAGGQVYMAAKNLNYNDKDASILTKKLLGSMAGMGKVGAIEFKDMSRQAGKIMSAAGQFGGKNLLENAQTMMAIGQFALGGGAQSPEEAGTAVMRFADDAAKNAKRFMNIGGKGKGFNVFTDDSQEQMISPSEILFKSLEMTGGNIPQMMKLFGLRGKKGMQPFRQMVVDVKKGLEEEGGGSLTKGLEVARAKMATMVNLAEDPEMTQRSAAAMRTTTTKRMAMVKEQFDQRLGPAALRIIETMLPALEKLIPLFESAATTLASFIEFLAENPYAGIAAIIGASVVGEIVSAGIGVMLANAIAGSVAAGGAGGLGIAGLGAAFTGLLGPIALLAAAIGGAYLAYKLVTDLAEALDPTSQKTALDQEKKEEELQDYLFNASGGDVKVGNINPDTGQSYTMEDEYNAKVDPVTGELLVNPSTEHTTTGGKIATGAGRADINLGAPPGENPFPQSLGLAGLLTPPASAPGEGGGGEAIRGVWDAAMNAAAAKQQAAADTLATNLAGLAGFPAELSSVLGEIQSRGNDPTKTK